MKYIRENISKYAKETGYIANNLEKVIRLMDVLQFFFNQSQFKDSLILKGGTAINLVDTNLRRLSVDIDLDYCASLDKETTLKDRALIEAELDNFMLHEEYQISPKSRSSYALLSKIYIYRSSSGNTDTIKVDINFMDRVHLYPLRSSTVSYFDHQVTVKTPSIEELFAMKINALIDRSKPRDLYDAMFLVEHLDLFNQDLLRKAVIFYLSINNTYDINDDSFSRINTVSYWKVRVELQPMLKKGECFAFEQAKDKVTAFLKELLVLSDSEKQYLSEFSKSHFEPSLLFDESISSMIKEHPMAKWRIANINK